MDILTAKLRFYNVCRAKTGDNMQGGHCNCGLAFQHRCRRKHMLGDSTVKLTGPFWKDRVRQIPATRTL
eukprot:8948970-Prorocentrum_lima.AAC.1